MKGAVFLIIVGVVGFAVFSAISREPTGGRPEAIIAIKGEQFAVALADTPTARAEGLSGRSALGENEGMLFLFPRPEIQRFWMKGMRIPIDIVWILEGTVVGFEERVLPEPGVPIEKLTVYQSPQPVDRVLEVKAGTVERLGIREGDRIITP